MDKLECGEYEVLKMPRWPTHQDGCAAFEARTAGTQVSLDEVLPGQREVQGALTANTRQTGNLLFFFLNST